MDTTIQATDEGSADLLTFAQGLFLEAAENLAAAIARIRDDDTLTPKTALGTARDMTAAFHTVMAERTRIDAIRTKVSGIAGGGTLDLDAARTEIGGRLARLRNAAGG